MRKKFWMTTVFFVCLLMVFSSFQSLTKSISNNTTALTRGVAKSPATDVKIVYDSSYKTTHYSCWSGGYSAWSGTAYNDLSTVKNGGVVRRGTTFTIIGTGATASTRITVKGPADVGESRPTVTGWNPTFISGSSWNLTIPSDAPVGDYQIYMDEEYCTLYVIFDVDLTKTPSGMTENEFASWAYTETAEGGKYPCDYGLGDPTPGITNYRCFEERMTELICSSMGSSTTTEFNASVNAYRLVNARLHWQGATTYPDATTMLNAGTDAASKSVAAITVSEARMVALQTGHTLPGNMIWATNCINHGNLISALIRAMGIPSRPLTMGDGSVAHSHVWEWGDFDTTGEAWIDKPDLTMSSTESKWIMFYPSDTSTSGTQNSNGEGEIDTEKNMYWHAYVLDTEPYTAIATENYVWRWKGSGNDPSAVAGWEGINMNSALTATENDLPTFELSSATDYNYYTNWLAMGDRDFFRVHIPTGMTNLNIGFVEGGAYGQLYVRKNTCVCSGADYTTASGLKTGYTYDSWGDDRILTFAVTTGDYVYVMVDNAKEFQYARDYMGDSFGNTEAYRYVIGVGKCPPYATVISPNGDEHLIAGSGYNVKWSAGDVQTLGASPITIEYSTDPPHTTWTGINGGTYSKSNDGVEAWNVPSTISDTVKIRVTVTDSDTLTGSDMSNNNFKIKKTPESLNDVSSGVGNADNDKFGWNLTSADVNNDGKDDIVVGAPYVDYGGNADCGAVYIFFGKASWGASDLNAANANVIIYGSAVNNAHFGWSVGNAGNVNGDVYNDIVVGEPDNGNGKAYVFFGRGSWLSLYTTSNANVTLTGESSGDKFGSSVSGAGDVNNDNYNDVIVGAYDYGTAKGRVYIYYGGSTMDAIADVTLTGENDNDKFGWSVAGGGNVDDDSYKDVIIGAPGYDSGRGKAYAYDYLKNGVYITNGQFTSNAAGWTYGESGDDGSATTGVATGAWSSTGGNTDAGCYKFVVADTLATTLYKVGQWIDWSLDYSSSLPNNLYARAGSKITMTVTAAGGFAYSKLQLVKPNGVVVDIKQGTTVDTGTAGQTAYEFLDGELGPYLTMSGTYKLRLYTYIETGDAAADKCTMNTFWDDVSLQDVPHRVVTRLGENANDNFGFSVASLGDVNGDTIDDFIIGAPGYENSKGKACIYYGSLSLLRSDTLTITQQLGDTSGDHFIGKATSIITIDSNTNYGTNNMWLGYYSGVAPAGIERILLQFELSDIPKDAVVIKSAVSVYEYSGSAGSIDAEAHRVAQMWDETKVTWNKYDGTNAWATPGGDFDSSVESIITIPDATARWCTWDITGLTKKWVNGTYTNYGVILKGTAAVEGSATSNDKWFRVDDYTTDYTQRPKIDITVRYPADLTITGENTGDNFGYSISSAGDAKGDGINDFAVGAPFNDNVASNAGAVYMFYGSNSLPKEINAGASDNATYGETLNDNFGFSVSSGNITGSMDDTITGSAYYGANDNGKAYVSTAQTLGPAGATATATGPTGLTNNTGVTLTYSYTGTPTSVKLYYTKNANATWTLADEDSPVDGSYAYTITSGDGTYGWIAVAIGGGSTETAPAGGTSAEKYGLILDTGVPYVTAVSPLNGATGVAITTTINKTFSEAMNNTTVEANFKVYQDGSGTPIAGTYSWAGNQCTFTPSSVLLGTTKYWSNVSTGAKDLAGNPLSTANNTYFTTAAGATATATGPTGFTNNTAVTIAYTWTLSPTSVKLYYTNNANTTWTFAGTDASVDGSYGYTITSGDGTYGWIAVAIGGGSTEADPPAGGTSAEAYGLILDTDVPGVSTTTPSNGATGVAFNQNIIVTFDEAMNTSVTPTLTQTAGTDPGGWSFVGWSGDTIATWSHNDWTAGDSVTMQVSGAKDKAGNTMAAAYSWSFTIEHYWLNLTTGWNLITITVDNATISRAGDLVNIIGKNCTAISYWNNTLGRFVTHPAGSDISNFSIEAGVGYKIYVIGNTNISIDGTPINSKVMNLKIGWNSIGWFNKTATDAQTLMNDIGSNCTGIAVWNATTQKFDVYQSGGNNFAIGCGEGVLVYMEGEENWTNE